MLTPTDDELVPVTGFLDCGELAKAEALADKLRPFFPSVVVTNGTGVYFNERWPKAEAEVLKREILERWGIDAVPET